MALNPLIIDELENVEVIEEELQPSKTYEFNFETGEFTERMTEGVEAVRQFIVKAIKTARFRFLIYDDDYGCELEDLIGEDLTHELLDSEIPRAITEALIYDERIESVSNFSISRVEDRVYITFNVETNDGLILEMEEVIF